MTFEPTASAAQSQQADDEAVIEFELPLVLPLRKSSGYKLLAMSLFFGVFALGFVAMWRSDNSVFLLLASILFGTLALPCLLMSYRQLRYPTQWSLQITEDAIIMPSLWGTKTHRWQHMHAVMPIQAANQIGLSFCNPGSSTARFLSFNMWSDEPVEFCQFLTQLHAMLTSAEPTADLI